MVALSDYSKVESGAWRIFALKPPWNAKLQDQVLALVGAQANARHAQTLEVSHQMDGEEKRYFLKVFHRTALIARVKDQLRPSPAFGSWRQGVGLAAAGFKVPLAIAAGRNSAWRVGSREFVLTEKIDGAPLAAYLTPNCAGSMAPLAYKRENIKNLASLVRRFHAAGFVHGDLVATNLFVVAHGTADLDFYFMDNDRTRRYPNWLPQALWKRNLIQLNRMPLPGISLQDRIRFLHAYLNVKRLSGADRQFARWLEAKTRHRRKECDGADLTISFRQLMRWAPNMAGVKNHSKSVVR